MNFQIVEHASSMPASVAPTRIVKPIALAKPGLGLGSRASVAAITASKTAVVAKAPPTAKVAAVAAVAAVAPVAAVVPVKPSIAPPTKFSYEASCSKLPGQNSMKCLCDPAAKGYKLDGSVCKPDASVKACPVVNKRQLRLGSNGVCV